MPDAPTTRLHVVGCPRSGTTLVNELLRYSYQFGGAADHEQSLFDDIGQAPSPFLSKKPADTIRIGKAFEADEHLFVIALIRDPRAVISSVHWSHPDMYFVGFARWRTYAEAIEAHSEHPRYLAIRYEDLLDDPAGIQRQIEARFSFLERQRDFAAYPEGIDSLHEHAQKALNGIRPFDTSRLSAWREHLPRIASEYARHPDFQSWLARYGYESDETWAECLEGVTPGGRSYKDATDAGLKKYEIAVRYWLKTRRYLRERAASS